MRPTPPADTTPTGTPTGTAPGTAPGRETNPLRTVGVPRVARGHLLMTAVGLAAAVLAFAALRARPGDQQVAVAVHEVRAGERLHRADFRVADVSIGDAGLGPLVGPAELRRLAGRFAGTTIEPGDVVPRRWLRPRAARAGRRAISIPVDPSRAVGGRLAAGDRIDVLVAGDDGVAIVVADAEVLAVDERGRGGIGDTASPFTVTVAVDEEQSRLVAAAVVSGGLSLARTTGATPALGDAPVPTTTPGRR